MADNVIARKNTQWLIVGLTPDVCKTPMGSSTPPIPYPVIAKLDAAVDIVPSVNANGDPLVVYDQSKIPQTIGDAPEVANGIKSGTVGANCYPDEHSKSVRAGGKYIIRHDDKWGMNGK